MATLDRRALLALAPAAFVTGCEPGMRTTASTTPKLDIDGLNRTMAKLADRARPGALGVGLMNLESGQTFTLNGERRFPMQSVFKLPLAATALAEVDARRLRLDEPVVLTKEQLSTRYSPIAEGYPTRRDYTLDEMLVAAITDSDNTAADVLMKRIGGPGAVTAWLVSKHVTEIRVDRYERELQPEVYGLPSFRPEWRLRSAYAAAFNAAPPAVRLAHMRAYMADPRDTATPRGMVEFLQALDRGELISPASTRRLLQLMSQTKRGGQRIRDGLPKDAFLAHRPGTGGEDQGLSVAHNDVGIFRLADKRAYALAVFLSGSTLPEAARDGLIADVTRAAVRGVG